MQKLLAFDPRYYQLVVQVSLLGWGMVFLQFPIAWQHIVIVLGCALIAQWACTTYKQLPAVYLSSFNTSLSILLLLTAQNPWWLGLAAVIAIVSKFVLRFEGRHIFNPSNIGIVVVLLLTHNVWVSSGKWGHELWLFLLVAGLGLIPQVGGKTMLVSISFLLSYAALLFSRAWYLGDPWAIPEHQMNNGSLLLFTFFMLSDPKTTPAHALARLLYGVGVAIVAALIQFKLYVPNAFLYALVLMSPLVVVLNRWFPAQGFEWNTDSLSKPVSRYSA
ncbi:RnfABCDGE type electron transport complex subunit D [Thiofilum flexile]|uniref:RnfABCDGE type electron transport complex subunit D n=1 Tax=Thiofilum flexile TaxID=125627 RepID=UPI00035C7C20|nr:RnfABCDGE type electron transport complex subunit D [Thiofilum flexile]